MILQQGRHIGYGIQSQFPFFAQVFREGFTIVLFTKKAVTISWLFPGLTADFKNLLDHKISLQAINGSGLHFCAIPCSCAGELPELHGLKFFYLIAQ